MEIIERDDKLSTKRTKQKSTCVLRKNPLSSDNNNNKK